MQQPMPLDAATLQRIMQIKAQEQQMHQIEAAQARAAAQAIIQGLGGQQMTAPTMMAPQGAQPKMKAY